MNEYPNDPIGARGMAGDDASTPHGPPARAKPDRWPTRHLLLDGRIAAETYPERICGRMVT